MKNYDLMKQKIEEGISYIQEQDKKLAPVLEYFSDQVLQRKDELTTEQIFEYYCKLQELKVNSLILLAKMKEILDYTNKK